MLKISVMKQSAHFNLVTGLLLIVLGTLDVVRNDYAFGASWVVFGCMYLSFESGISPRMRQLGMWLGLLTALLTLFYYLQR